MSDTDSYFTDTLHGHSIMVLSKPESGVPQMIEFGAKEPDQVPLLGKTKVSVVMSSVTEDTRFNKQFR